MSVAAIYTCRDEADILELSFRHMLAEGISHIYTTCGDSSDNTREILDELAAETGQITIIEDHEPYYQQVRWINELLAIAGGAGHDWIISSDVDEFWYAVCGQTVASTLETMLGPGVRKLYAKSYQHNDWNTRHVDAKRLPKVAVRWEPGISIAIGSHEASPVVGVSDVLSIRELQYRSFDHFVKKARASSATIPPDVRAIGGAWHHIRLDGMSDEDMRKEWDAIMAIPTQFDPIPTHMALT